MKSASYSPIERLDAVVEAVAGVGTSRQRLRAAQASIGELLADVRAEPAAYPSGFEARVRDAEHCLSMGKPRECLALLRALRAELEGR